MFTVLVTVCYSVEVIYYCKTILLCTGGSKGGPGEPWPPTGLIKMIKMAQFTAFCITQKNFPGGMPPDTPNSLSIFGARRRWYFCITYTKSVTNIYQLGDKHILTRWQPNTNSETNIYQVGDRHFNQKTAVARFVIVCRRVSTWLSPSLCRRVFIDVTELVCRRVIW